MICQCVAALAMGKIILVVSAPSLKIPCRTLNPLFLYDLKWSGVVFLLFVDYFRSGNVRYVILSTV